MARSSRRRPSTPSRADVSGARTAPDAFLEVGRAAGGARYGRLDEPGPALELFAFAAAATPAPAAIAGALGAWLAPSEGAGDPGPSGLVGAALLERAGRAAMLYGPVVIVDPARAGGGAELAREAGAEASPPSAEPPGLTIAAALVAAALDLLAHLGAETVFVRPQGLDRIWIRFGFIPVPEGALPPGLRGRPGAGLFAYRGGSALWSLREVSSD